MRVLPAVALLLLSSTFGALVAAQEDDAAEPTRTLRTSPLVINSRDDWAREGIPGNGTSRAPYVIERLRTEIPAASPDAALSITSVPDHVIVRDVLAVGGVGIQVLDAPNARIENSTARNGRTGFELRGVVATHLTASGNSVGIDATNSTVRGCRSANNGYGVVATGGVVEDCLLESNGIGIQVRPGDAVAEITRVRILDARASGILSSAGLRVQASDFDRTPTAVRLVVPADVAVVTDSNFGNHSEAAIQAPVEPEDWAMDARNNFWGRDNAGRAALPSPFGLGSPVVGHVVHEPVRNFNRAAGPNGTVGAQHAGGGPPTLVDAGSSFRTTSEGDEQVLVVVRIQDPDGIAEWVVRSNATSDRVAVPGETTTNAVRTYPVTPDVESMDFVVEATDFLGRRAALNVTVLRNPPAPPADDNATLNETPPQPAEEAPAAGVVAVALLATAAALARRKR